MKSVYIAGQSGASGLVLHELVRQREDIRLLSREMQGRESLDRETELLNTADVVILCLPLGVVHKTVERITNLDVRVIDNSTAHSVAEDWVYGLPELNTAQRDTIRQARRVSGPGCFATGVILTLRPLVEWGIVDSSAPVCVQGIGGYSSGGKRMIEWYEQPQGSPAPVVQVFGLNLDHAQVPEMQHHTGLQRPPLFVPWVGQFRQGTLVSIPLHRDWLKAGISPSSVRESLRDRYAQERLVCVRTRGLMSSISLPQAMGCEVELFVEGKDHLLLVARLDNLGKGSAVAALQNMNLLLGCDEFAGISADQR